MYSVIQLKVVCVQAKITGLSSAPGFLWLFFIMKQKNRTKAEWIKFAALLLVFIKVAALLFVLIIILAGLFSGHQSGQKSISLFGFLDTEVFGSITYKEALNLLILGFISGSVGGMLGMGGGLLKIVNLHLFLGFELIFARVISLISYSVISLSAFLRYRKYDLILWDVAKMLIPSSILGVLLGIVIGNMINKEYVEIILGIYALFAGVIVVNQIWVKTAEKEISELPKNEISETAVSGIGIGMGILCSIIGISGGILSTPLQNTLLKLPLKNSIANTITAAVFCSITASVILLFYGLKSGDYLGENVLIVTICLIPGNIIGAQFGSYFTKRLQINYVRAVFAIVAFAIGFKILVK